MKLAKNKLTNFNLMSCHSSEWNAKQNSFTFSCRVFLLVLVCGFLLFFFFFAKKKAFSFILTIQTSLPLKVFLMINGSHKNKVYTELVLLTGALATGMNAINLHFLANGHQVLVLASS